VIWWTPAFADELPELSQSSWAAVADRARTLAADPKKGKKLLAKAGFASVGMPAEARRGAELSLSAIGRLEGCTWTDHATCVLTAQASPGAKAAEYAVQCKMAYGASFPMTATGTETADGKLTWTVDEVDACWDIDAKAVLIVPNARGDLEGVGKGDDMIPPELVELSQKQVEDELRGHMSAFQYCTRKFSEDRQPVAGKMQVRYHIADDGSVDRADVESATFSDERIQGCITGAFRKLRFPKPMGGFTGGTFPLTFVGS
jgi:hypothetical protein